MDDERLIEQIGTNARRTRKNAERVENLQWAVGFLAFVVLVLAGYILFG